MDTPPMKRCTKCGVEKPATGEYFAIREKEKLRNHCRTCRASYSQEHYQRNREEIRVKHRDHYERNREQIQARHQEYNRRNVDRIRGYHREWNKRNTDRTRDQKRQYHQEWAKRNATWLQKYNQDWRRDNREKVILYSHNRRSLEKNAPGKIEEWWWKRCLNYFGHRCAACGRPKGLWHTLSPDHWHTPLSQGGGNAPDNIIPLCFSLKDGTDGCNNTKSTRNHLEWLYDRFPKKEADAILARIEAYFIWVKEQDS